MDSLRLFMVTGSYEGLKVYVNCTKVPNESFESSFGNQDKSIYNKIENYKKTKQIKRIQGNSLPVLVSIDNLTPNDIENLKIEIFIAITAFKSSNKTSAEEYQFPLEYDYSYILRSNEFYNGLLFDMSGFYQATITLRRVEYNIAGKTQSNNIITNMPLLINTDDLTNAYHGYRNQQEMQNYLLLKNYIQNSFPARGLLLKFMFNMLKELNKNRSFEYEGETFTFGSNEMPSILGMLQIDIVAKIMMYIEDLIILLEGVRERNGDYYRLLDKEKDEDIDVGKRIGRFFSNKDNISSEDWKRMASYLNSVKSDVQSEVITKLIENNISAFRELIDNFQIFSITHSPIFRRYKHAGFPFKPGYISPISYPFTSRKFDFYSMTFVGANPLIDVIPLPFSDDIIESYRILVHALQRMISHIVNNKIQCIRRRVERIIPDMSFLPVNAYSAEESSRIKALLNNYNNQYPNRAYDDVYDFPLNASNTQNMKWYIHLDENMKKWKSVNEIKDT